MKLKVASVQMASALGNKAANLDKMVRAIAQIKAQDPEVALIVFPECAVDGYECPELFLTMAEFYPTGASIVKLSEASCYYNVHLIFGFIELDEQGKIYNSAALIDNFGEPIGCCRKAHLVQGMEEKIFSVADCLSVYNTKIGCIGIMICWDSAFPEVARVLALKGAEIIVVPEAVEKGIEREWELFLGARALDNGVWLLACNHSGVDRNLCYSGRSVLFSPFGDKVVQLGEKEDILYSEIDLAKIEEARDYFYMLRQRRPEVYLEIASRSSETF